MKILILDDDKERHENFKRNFKEHVLTHVETANDAINELKSFKYDAVFLDHDLGGLSFVDSSEPNTGYQVAKWLSNNMKHKPKLVYIHSMNPVGAQKMKDLLPNSILAPSLWLVKQN